MFERRLCSALLIDQKHYVNCEPLTTRSAFSTGGHFWFRKLHLVHLCKIKTEKWRFLARFSVAHVWLPVLLSSPWVFSVFVLGFVSAYVRRAACLCFPLSKRKLYFVFLFYFVLCTASSSVSSFPSSDHLFQGQLFSGLTREWYRRLLPRSISSKWSKGEFTLLTFPCTVAVLTFNCLSVFRANSHLVPDNCAIAGLPRLARLSLGHHLKQPFIA